MNRIYRLSKGFTPIQSGFTLIELLIVIAVLGVLAGGVLITIDPVDKINAANDAKVQNDVSGIGRATEAYATVHNGFYPDAIADLSATGELKKDPVPPSGYSAYAVQNMLGSPPAVPSPPAGCVDGAGASPTCTGIIITGQLKSKKFTGTTVWRYESTSGKSCAVGATTTACP